MNKHGTVLGGALLVAGTTIGGGMLALPVLTGPGGFIPAHFIYLACWLFMTLTGLLFLEISLHMEEGANIVSMARRTLGWSGKAVAWGLYLFLFYCLTIAYLVGCGDIISSAFKDQMPRSFGPLVFALMFAPFLYAGTKVVGKLNYFLVGALAILYVAFVALGAGEVKVENLLHRDWALSLIALPIAFTAFAYQGIVPTLVAYMDRDVKKIRKSIWIGTTIPLITYIIWQWLIIGIVPLNGEHGLLQTLNDGRNAVYPLQFYLNNPYVFLIGEYFAFFALLTSFFGVCLGLIDFLADGLAIKKDTQGKFILLTLVLVPPLGIASIYPDIFLKALDYAGGYGCALLLGLLPIIMAYVLRQRHPEYIPQVKGGTLVLSLMALFVLFELAIEILF